MSLVSIIYREVFNFLKTNGFISRLKTSLKISEHERYTKLKIDETGLGVLDATHCVYDKKRSLIFLNEVARVARSGDTVLEAGIGTGILSFMAASKGATVYGVELNPATLKVANDIKKYLLKKGVLKSDQIHFELGDATKYIPKKKVDTIICENIYNGMFYEKQVQIMNHLQTFLKKGGHTIPSKLQSVLFLGEAKFPHDPKNKEGFSPSKEKKFSMRKKLSDDIKYDLFDFTKKNKTKIDKILRVKAIRSGKVNSITFYSVIFMPSGKKIGRNETTFLAEDFVIAIKPSVVVNKGDSIKIKLRFPYGERPQKALVQVTRG